ncbi:MAG: DNA ligase [Thalassotalea sp.]
MKVISTLVCALLVIAPIASAAPNKAKIPTLQLAKNYQQQDIKIGEYWVSEKLDGIRGVWSGSHLYTRQGNLIDVPNWFTKDWPKVALDGELWLARNSFEQTLSCVSKKNDNNQCWQQLAFMVFDLPNNQADFSTRIKTMRQLLTTIDNPYLKVISQQQLHSIDELHQLLDNTVKLGGEGLMIHKADAYYTKGRTANILKVKKYHDAEAVVIEHLPGKAKLTGLLGAIKVKTDSGIEFKIGSGFSLAERKNPPPLGAIISYKYLGLTKNGVPKFASFVRIRPNIF